MSQHARPVGPTTTNDAAAFDQSMAQGCLPDRTPLRESWRQISRRAGWHSGQTTHVSAPFDPAMATGAHPDRNREWLPLRVGVQEWVSDIALFSVDMVQGARPDLPRLFLAPRIPLPVSQTTQTDAPFSMEMAAGARPDRPRPAFKPHEGWVQSPNIVTVFAFEMLIGAWPSQPRLRYQPKIGWQLSQTTHVAAPIGPEMTCGSTEKQVAHARPVRDRQGYTWYPIDGAAPIFVVASPWQLNTGGVLAVVNLNTGAVLAAVSVNSSGVLTAIDLNTNAVQSSQSLNTDGISVGS
jgi:hypothetical protein